jgi:ArsR family transcriptional regulator, arsenate/arsenite/antimonite-responsive transcriptional repressor
MTMGELEGIFKGLADRTRLRIVSLLLHGELCVCDIQYVLGSPQPNVSRHLAYLKHSGLVADRREGQRMFYRLAGRGDGMRKQLFAFLRGAFAASDEFERDSRKLKKAIERGSCTASEWRPLTATAKSGDPSVDRLCQEVE